MADDVIVAVFVGVFIGAACGTTPQAEAMVEPLDCFFESPAMDERTDIAGAIVLAQTHQRETRQIFSAIRPQQEIAFVVAQLHVVSRAVFFDEFLFQKERFLLVSYLIIIKIFNGGDECACLSVLQRGTRRGKIIGEPFVEIFCLTHVDDAPSDPTHQVNPGAMRRLPPFFFELTGSHRGDSLYRREAEPASDAQLGTEEFRTCHEGVAVLVFSRMKNIYVASVIGAGALFLFSSCSSTDGDGYAESAMPMSEIADGEIPPWLLEDDGTNGAQVGAGSHTPTAATRNEYAIPEPTSTASASQVSTRQNQPKLDSGTQDGTIVETPTGVTGTDPLASTQVSHPDEGVTTVSTGTGKKTSGGKKSGSGKKTGKKPKKPTMIVYKVRPGDNLTVIAKKSNTTVEQIRRDSNIKGSTIYPGQVIKVRYTPKGYKGDKSTSKQGGKKGTSTGGAKKTHTVKSGQTLSGIAAKYGISTSKLMKANGIAPSKANQIQVGRKLVIPGKN